MAKSSLGEEKRLPEIEERCLEEVYRLRKERREEGFKKYGSAWLKSTVPELLEDVLEETLDLANYADFISARLLLLLAKQRKGNKRGSSKASS